jgi:hypothetical protein
LYLDRSGAFCIPPAGENRTRIGQSTEFRAAGLLNGGGERRQADWPGASGQGHRRLKRQPTAPPERAAIRSPMILRMCERSVAMTGDILARAASLKQCRCQRAWYRSRRLQRADRLSCLCNNLLIKNLRSLLETRFGVRCSTVLTEVYGMLSRRPGILISRESWSIISDSPSGQRLDPVCGERDGL